MNEKQKLETSNTAGLRNDAHLFSTSHIKVQCQWVIFISETYFSISSLCCTLNYEVDYDKQRAFWFFKYTVDICTL